MDDNEVNYAKLFIEFLILLSLYVIMSQPFVISIASTYIDQLNPNDNGDISLTGIIIYGVILTLLFMVIRKIVLSKF